MHPILRLLANAGLVLGAMALLAVCESIVPFRRGSRWRRAHLGANMALTAATLLLNIVLTVLVFGLARAPTPSARAIVLGVLVLDLGTYVAHWSMHRVPVLWRFHRVHHADPLVDVTTALRQHPLEGLLRFAFLAALAVALGIPPGAVAVYRMLSVLNALLEHTNVRVWQPFDRVASLVVTTPNMHKIHHSKLPRETDTNYGNILSIFDRLFGTFTPTGRATQVEYGLSGHDAEETQRLPALLRLPFHDRMR